MTKRQLIDEIRSLNVTAEPGFLASFGEADLTEYLQHLQTARQRRPKYCDLLPAEPVPVGVTAETIDDPETTTPFANLTEETDGVLF